MPKEAKKMFRIHFQSGTGDLEALINELARQVVLKQVDAYQNNNYVKRKSWHRDVPSC